MTVPTRLAALRAALVIAPVILAGGAAPLGTPPSVSAALPHALLASPVEPFEAVRLVDLPDRPWDPGHRGIDLVASVGQPVLSPGSGVVTFAGTVVDRGVVTVAHGGRLVSSVEPVEASVTVGDRVAAGEVIGVVTEERGHCGATTCLHWGVRLDGSYIDPLDVLAGFGPIRLLPLGDLAPG